MVSSAHLNLQHIPKPFNTFNLVKITIHAFTCLEFSLEIYITSLHKTVSLPQKIPIPHLEFLIISTNIKYLFVHQTFLNKFPS